MFEATAIVDLLAEVQSHDFAGDMFGAERIEAIKGLDRVIRAGQAEQAAQIGALHRQRSAQMVGHGDPTLSVIGEVGMARHIGPAAAGTQVGMAIALGRFPKVFDLFKTGVISEATARAVTTETAALGGEQCGLADDQLADKIPGMTTREAGQAAARVVIGIDAEAARVRAERNRADQRVTLHPEVDGVATLIVRGPAEQLLAAHQTLDTWATGLRATGDTRTRGQIMCSSLVERVTGVAHADATDVEINLVLDAKALLDAADGQDAVELEGYGPICPDVTADLIARAPNASIRRLLADPVDGSLTVREPRRRFFDHRTAGFLRARDRVCRQPGCHAKIRALDHIEAFEAGGLTTAGNGQGLCTRSHTLKHLPGWSVRADGNTIIWRTPSGHEYRSNPPPVIPPDSPR